MIEKRNKLEKQIDELSTQRTRAGSIINKVDAALYKEAGRGEDEYV